ncbi:MAG: hypothetical protein KAQ85_00220 [Thermodesulfovibrionia bacterium]|nr:hypothetical protein [Thermodesulfovibrionia bacterium]
MYEEIILYILWNTVIGMIILIYIQHRFNKLTKFVNQRVGYESEKEFVKAINAKL